MSMHDSNKLIVDIKRIRLTVKDNTIARKQMQIKSKVVFNVQSVKRNSFIGPMKLI